MLVPGGPTRLRCSGHGCRTRRLEPGFERDEVDQCGRPNRPTKLRLPPHSFHWVWFPSPCVHQSCLRQNRPGGGASPALLYRARTGRQRHRRSRRHGLDLEPGPLGPDDRDPDPGGHRHPGSGGHGHTGRHCGGALRATLSPDHADSRLHADHAGVRLPDSGGHALRPRPRARRPGPHPRRRPPGAAKSSAPSGPARYSQPGSSAS